MGRRDQGEATVYQKHRSVRSRKTMYTDRLLPGAGRLRGLVSLFWAKLRI